MQQNFSTANGNLLPSNNSPSQWSSRIIKVQLWHLDGTVSEMKLSHPIYSWSGTFQEVESIYLTACIQHLTKHHLQISAFQLHVGSVNEAGNEQYSYYYPKYEIPIGKVYVPVNPKGKWANPEEEEKRQSKKQQKRVEKNTYLKVVK